MFDLGKQKRGIPEYKYDVEDDLKDPAKRRAIKENMDSRVQQLKKMLNQGADKKLFDQIQLLLHGYLAMQKVIERAQKKKN